MLIDWNNNGQFDSSDLALSLAILEDERRREEDQRRQDTQADDDNR